MVEQAWTDKPRLGSARLSSAQLGSARLDEEDDLVPDPTPAVSLRGVWVGNRAGQQRVAGWPTRRFTGALRPAR